MAGVKRRMFTGPDIHAFHKELDEVSCPICMDHPHNVVLLLCTSHEKGCRSYICDTSYRHSNCLDRFKKLRENSRNNTTLTRSLPVNMQSTGISDVNLASRGTGNPDTSETNDRTVILFPEALDENIEESDRHSYSQREGMLEIGDSVSLRERVEVEELQSQNLFQSKETLKCPMCRGDVLEFKVVEEARKYLNLKNRSCSRESCNFSGNYQELRRHARRVHPTTRPSDADPSREQAWHRLERQREFGDIMSAIHTALPGAVVIGDYVIEDGDRASAEREGGASDISSPWWSTYFLLQMVGSLGSVGEARVRSRAWSRYRRNAGTSTERRLLWGENLLNLQDDNDDDALRMLNEVEEDDSPVPRRRRRVMRSRSDGDQSR